MLSVLAIHRFDYIMRLLVGQQSHTNAAQTLQSGASRVNLSPEDIGRLARNAWRRS
jgi:hypothetical protein